LKIGKREIEKAGRAIEIERVSEPFKRFQARKNQTVLMEG
jgi:hypothetical protein